MSRLIGFFTRHPESLGESYFEHFCAAGRFGFIMIWGGARTIVHALVPAWFETSGSDTIRALHIALVHKRADKRRALDDLAALEWVI